VNDADVPAVWQALGLPGIVDVHVHFMPDNVLRKVWSYFDSAGPLTGRPWPIRYRWPEEQRLAHLRAMGIRAFPSLVYPHRPDMAAWLNDWSLGFAAGQPDVIATATFFPEESATAYVGEALTRGARMFKAHVQVGGYDPRDERLDGVWGQLAEAGVPFGEVLQRHPQLTAVIAHLGMPEYDDFLGFADRYANVHVDTTMAFVDFFDATESRRLGRALAPRLAALQHKVLFGTDFPNIPYDYAHQIEVLQRLDLGDDWMRAVLWENGVRLMLSEN
jgi:hypothetical protein